MFYSLWFRRYAPYDTFGFGFEGDGRTEATTDITATARTTSGVGFNKEGKVLGGIGDSSGTDHVLWPFRKVTGKVKASVRVETRTNATLRFIAASAGSNPLAPGWPPINTFVNVSVVFTNTHMGIDGRVSGNDFPHAEVFIYDGSGTARMLFEYATTRGRNMGPVTGLFGEGEDRTLGRFSERIPLTANGAFQA